MIDFSEVTKIQDRAISETRNARRPGGAILIVAPTGAGKTRINSKNIENFAHDFRAEHRRNPHVLALQHRGALLEQARDALARWSPDCGLSISTTREGELDQSGDVNFATVQSIVSRLNELKSVDLLTIDEAHHASNSKDADYTKVLEFLQTANPNLTIIATTATPTRPDRRGLNPLLQNASQVTIGYAELQRAGQIKLPKTKVVNIRTADGGTTTSIMRSKYKPEKDADPAGLTKALRLARPADYHEQMADAWEVNFKHRMDSKNISAGTIAFDPTIASAHVFAEEIAARGYKVAVIDSEQDKEDNANALSRYCSGMLDMIVSCKMLDEGIDAPGTRCIIINRETTSEIEYHQMVGRAMRMGNDPVLQGIDPVVLDGGASTMIHGSVERRATVIDYFQRLERGEIDVQLNEDAKWMPQLDGETYSPWRLLKDPPPVMAVTDGKSSIYAVASKSPTGKTLFSLAETQTIKGRAEVRIMKDSAGRPLVGIEETRLRQIEAERLLPARHNLLRMEATESHKFQGKSLVDERLQEHPEHIRTAEIFAATMARGFGR